MIIMANPVIMSTDEELEAPRKQAEGVEEGELSDLIMVLADCRITGWLCTKSRHHCYQGFLLRRSNMFIA
jgi:hypothetical protein